MAFENAVITDEGVKMLNNALEKTLILDHAAGGSGTVNPLHLIVQTGLADQKQVFSIAGMTDTKSDSAGKKIHILMSNNGLASSYQLQQVGIYAHIEGEDEPRLFAILQDETGYLIPSESEISDFLISFYAVFSVSRDAHIEVNVDPSAFVTIEQLTAAVDTATSRSWEVEVPASGWGPSTETWGDLTAKYEATIEVPDMTEAPEVIKIDFAGGSRAAAGRWTWITCTAGSVTLYSAHDPAPAADFSILVTEVR